MRAHFITVIEYVGAYTGSDESAYFYFRDSSDRNPKDGKFLREKVDVKTMLAVLETNDGRGSCAGNLAWNVIW